MVIHALQAGATTPVGDGRRHVRHRALAAAGRRPAVQRARLRRLPQRARSRAAWARRADTFVTRVGRIDNGVFDPTDAASGGPVARAHSIASLGFFCGLPTGVPPLANVTSRRSAMTLRGTALIDFVQNQRHPGGAGGRAGRRARQGERPAPTGGSGKFGWKAQFATLDRVHGRRLHPRDGGDQSAGPRRRGQGCGANFLKPEIDALPLQTVDTFMATLDPAVPDAELHLRRRARPPSPTVGCASCHTPVVARPRPDDQPLLGSAGPRHGAGAGRSVRRRLGQRQRVADGAALARLRARPLPARRPRATSSPTPSRRTADRRQPRRPRTPRSIRRRSKRCWRSSAASEIRGYARRPPARHWRWRSAASLLSVVGRSQSIETESRYNSVALTKRSPHYGSWERCLIVGDQGA